jgi:hypothetical protein
MIQEIKLLRVQLDELTKLTQQLDKSREVSLAITKLQESKMWLGKVLKEIGASNPYPDSKNPANEKIEPTADTAGVIQGFDMGYSHIQRVKYLREKLEYLESKYRILAPDNYNKILEYYLSESYKDLLMGGMWLGMELSNHRKDA